MTVLPPGTNAGQAACSDVLEIVDAAFEKGGTNAATWLKRYRCAGCPIQEGCLSYAMLTDQHFGVWGSTTARERRKAAKSA